MEEIHKTVSYIHRKSATRSWKEIRRIDESTKYLKLLHQLGIKDSVVKKTEGRNNTAADTIKYLSKASNNTNVGIKLLLHSLGKLDDREDEIVIRNRNDYKGLAFLHSSSQNKSLHQIHRLVSLAGYDTICQCPHKKLVYFNDGIAIPQQDEPPTPTDVLPSLQRIVSFASRGETGMTRSEVLLLINNKPRRQELSDREIRFIRQMRSENNYKKQKRRDNFKEELQSSKEILQHIAEQEQLKIEEEKEAQKLEAAALRKTELDFRERRRFADRQIEARFRILFDASSAFKKISFDSVQHKAGVMETNHRNQNSDTLNERRRRFQAEVKRTCRLQKDLRTESRVVERWRQEACKIYLEKAYANATDTQKLDRSVQASIVKYTLRLEKRAQEDFQKKQLNQLRSAILDTFQAVESEKLRHDLTMRERKMRIERIRADVQANYEPNV